MSCAGANLIYDAARFAGGNGSKRHARPSSTCRSAPPAVATR